MAVADKILIGPRMKKSEKTGRVHIDRSVPNSPFSWAIMTVLGKNQSCQCRESNRPMLKVQIGRCLA